MDKTRLVLKTLSAIFHKTRSYSRGFLMPRPLLGDTNCILYLPAWLSRPRCKSCIAPHTGIYIYIHYTRVWAWVTEYMQVSMLVNTMLCLNNRYLHIFSHPPPYPSTTLKPSPFEHLATKHIHIGMQSLIHQLLLPQVLLEIAPPFRFWILGAWKRNNHKNHPILASSAWRLSVIFFFFPHVVLLERMISSYSSLKMLIGS